MNIVTVLRVSFVVAVVGVTAIARPVQAQTPTQQGQDSTTQAATAVSQPVTSTSEQNSEKPAPAIAANSTEATQPSASPAPVSFRVPLRSKIFPAPSMAQ